MKNNTNADGNKIPEKPKRNVRLALSSDAVKKVDDKNYHTNTIVDPRNPNIQLNIVSEVPHTTLDTNDVRYKTDVNRLKQAGKKASVRQRLYSKLKEKQRNQLLEKIESKVE